jgi:hypothetical protein
MEKSFGPGRFQALETFEKSTGPLLTGGFRLGVVARERRIEIPAHSLLHASGES